MGSKYRKRKLNQKETCSDNKNIVITWSSSDSDEETRNLNKNNLKLIATNYLSRTDDNYIVNNDESVIDCLVSPVVTRNNESPSLSPVIKKRGASDKQTSILLDNIYAVTNSKKSSEKIIISQFCTPNCSFNPFTSAVHGQETSVASESQFIGVEHVKFAKQRRYPKSQLAISLLKACDIHQAKIAMWNHELSKGMNLTPEAKSAVLELKIESCAKEFNNNILSCELLNTLELLNNPHVFLNYVLNTDIQDIYNSSAIILQNKYLIISNCDSLNINFQPGLQFTLYPPYNIKINQEIGVSYILNGYKILLES